MLMADSGDKNITITTSQQHHQHQQNRENDKWHEVIQKSEKVEPESDVISFAVTIQQTANTTYSSIHTDI